VPAAVFQLGRNQQPSEFGSFCGRANLFELRGPFGPASLLPKDVELIDRLVQTIRPRCFVRQGKWLPRIAILLAAIFFREGVVAGDLLNRIGGGLMLGAQPELRYDRREEYRQQDNIIIG
jgi:hypothetical protein